MGDETKSKFSNDDENAGNKSVDIVKPDKTIIPEVEITNLIIPDRDEFERKFVRKLDFRLLPLMMLICMKNADWIYELNR